MSSGLLIDNWTLQDCGEILSNGITGETTAQLRLDAIVENEMYDYVSADVVRLEALFQSLNDVILAEEIFVDAQFTNAWSQYPPLRSLIEDRMVIAKPLKEARSDWIQTREAIVEELCVTDFLRARHASNVESLKSSGNSVDRFLSQLIWGGAGMLARADFLRIPLSTHPLRDAVFRRAGLLPSSTDARKDLQVFVNEERLKIFGSKTEHGITGSLILPPAVSRIISNANNVDDLFRVAIQMRPEYKRLREWIGEFQRALDAEDAADLLSRKRLLKSVAGDLQAMRSPSKLGEISMQFGLSLPKFSIKLPSSFEAISKRIGIRSQIKRLILSKAGRSAFRRVLKLLGEERSSRGYAIEQQFMRHNRSN